MTIFLEYKFLEGKVFSQGAQDCYQVVRDFYRHNYGIVLKRYASPQDFWLHNLDILKENLSDAGFLPVGSDLRSAQPGDVLLFSLGVQFPNHLGVYLGDNQIIHHVPKRLSATEPLKAGLRHAFCYTVRHPLVAEKNKALEPVVEKLDLVDLLSSFNKRRLSL